MTSPINVGDSKAQLRVVTLYKNNPELLYESLTSLSISLVMGVEVYVRGFQPSEAVPLLVSVAEKYMNNNEHGDVILMTFRSLSLILELVPSSYDAAQEYHRPIMKLLSTAMHKGLCYEWHYNHSDTAMMMEECLRVIKFIGRDDPTGTMIRYALVGDLLSLCVCEDPVLVRKALETLLTLCSKVVMPSEFERPSSGQGFFSLFKSKKKSPVGSSDDSATQADNPIVVNVVNVIAPFLLTLIGQYTASIASAAESWAPLELALQCLGVLAERALLCHRSSSAGALMTKELPLMLFRLINIIEESVALEASVRAERVLLCETVLAIVPLCRRELLADSMMDLEAQRFFHGILGDGHGSQAEITSLDEPFPRGSMAARSTQRRDKDHITSIAALQLFVLACPTVPSDAFGLKPKVLLPVHQWLWEDELRHQNRLMEEQCVMLETKWSCLSREAHIIVQTKTLTVDLHAMTVSRGPTTNGYRNIGRQFMPFVYHFADEQTLRPVAAVKDSGPQATGARSKRSASGKTGDSGSSSGVLVVDGVAVPEAHVAIAEEYFEAICGFASRTSGQMARQLATCACASILQLLLLSTAKTRVNRVMRRVMLPFCEMARGALVSADKATKAVVLTMIQWLLQRGAADQWDFCETALRCGLVHQLDLLSKSTVVVLTKDSKPTRTATLAESAGTLRKEIARRLETIHPAFIKDPFALNPGVARLKRAVDSLAACASLDGPQEKPLLEVLQALSEVDVVTPFELFRIAPATAVINYLLGDLTLDDLFGPPLVFASSASGSTSSRRVGDRSLLKLNGRNTPLEAHSTWSSMIASGVRSGDVLCSRSRKDRITALRRCGAKCAKGLQRLVSSVVSTLPLDNNFPLVQSAVTYDNVSCKTPIQAFLAFTEFSPVVSLCGKAGRTISELSGPSGSSRSTLAASQQAPPPSHSPRRRSGTATALLSSFGAGPSGPAGGTPKSVLQVPMSTLTPPANNITNVATGLSRLTTGGPTTDVSQRNPRNYCFKGHRLGEMPSYNRVCICDSCDKIVTSGYCCRACNFDVCKDCYKHYKGNATLFESLAVAAVAPRNRAHLLASVGDIERHFRTGASTTKGTQVAPTSQSSLQHLMWFVEKAKHFLSRQQSSNLPVAQKLLQDSELLQKMVYDILQTYYTRGVLATWPPSSATAGSPSGQDAGGSAPAAKSSAGGSGSATRHHVNPNAGLSDKELALAKNLLREALEDRYILYRPFVGLCPYQETFLSVLYRHAFATGNTQALLQFENCLLKLEGSTEALTLPTAAPSVPSSAVREARNSSMSAAPVNLEVDRHSRSLSSTSERREPVSSPGKISSEFGSGTVAKEQSFVFHYFENDEATSCSCGSHTRKALHTQEAPTLFFNVPEFARRNDVQLLILLYKLYIGEDAGAEGLHEGDGAVLNAAMFTNAEITTTLVKSLEASALRASLLPPQYALPRWVNFILNDARFLVPLAVRERVARFLAYGVRRSLISHLLYFHQFRYDRSVAITGAEWTRMATHKFTVERGSNFFQDAFVVMRKAADARMPISIEFRGDIGVGQGPTAQFYTLLAEEVSRSHLRLWRNTSVVPTDQRNGADVSATSVTVPVTSKRFVTAPPEGLFPCRMTADGRPPPPHRFPPGVGQLRTVRRDKTAFEDPTIPMLDYMESQRDRAKALYVVGAALGRAFLDEQVLPLPLCTALSFFLRNGTLPYRLVVDTAHCKDEKPQVPVDVLDIPLTAVRLVDRGIYSSLSSLNKMDDSTLHSLDLTFTLPGDDTFELIPGGGKITVTRNNLELYQRRVVSALMYESVALPLHQILLGFSDVVPREALGVLEIRELMGLLCGEDRQRGDPLWNAADIKSVLVGDHGYQNDSPQLDMLARILGTRLSPLEQCSFLRFCTGCPRLPLGGVRALGAITVVKRSNAFTQARHMAAEMEQLQRTSSHGGGDGGDRGHPDCCEAEDDDGPLGILRGSAIPGLNPGQLNSDRESTLQLNGTVTSYRGTVTTAMLEDEQLMNATLPESEWALPSVNTCFRYLKLPPYPTEELMYKKLLLSITQAGDTFELS